MYRTGRQTLVTIAAVGALLGAFCMARQTFPAISGSPLVVTMSGTLQPFTVRDSQSLNTLTVTIGGKQKWLLNVTRCETVTEAQPGVMLLNQIFPPALSIEGATSDMAVLADPSVVGKSVTLQGFLYLADRTFYVGQVSVAGQTAQETR